MAFTACFDYRRFAKISWIFALLSVVLLALVFVPFLGVESYGAKRWVGIGSFTFQPSEFAKFGFIILRLRTWRKIPPVPEHFVGSCRCCASAAFCAC